MTLDKIRHYIGQDLYNHWGSVTDKEVIEKARDILQAEITAGLLTGIKYAAELELLNSRLL